MTHDYKKALDAMRKAFERTDLGLDSWLHGIGAVIADYRQVHLYALQLAQEAEQLRKERDDLKSLKDVLFNALYGLMCSKSPLTITNAEKAISETQKYHRNNISNCDVDDEGMR